MDSCPQGQPPAADICLRNSRVPGTVGTMIPSPAISVSYPTRRDARYVAMVVFAATMFSFLDRQILAILVDPIRRDLHVSDTGMSLDRKSTRLNSSHMS